MTRTDLEALIASYLHRNDLGGVIPGFIELATARLARDLRSTYNEVYETVAVNADPMPLPDNWQAFRAVAQVTNGGTPWPLRYIGSHEIGKYSTTGGGAQVYSIVARNLQIRPYQAGDYQYNYYEAPATLTLGSDTNPVLTNLPYLYLYASLVEAFIYIQDESLAANMISVYNGELSAVNLEAKKSRTGDAPAMRAV